MTCAGVPVRSATEGGLEFLSYGCSSSGWRGSCVVTFVLKDDAVQTINYSSRTGVGGRMVNNALMQWQTAWQRGAQTDNQTLENSCIS